MGEKNDEDILLEKKINTDKGLNAAFLFLEGTANHLVWWMWIPKGYLIDVSICKVQRPNTG